MRHLTWASLLLSMIFATSLLIPPVTVSAQDSIMALVMFDFGDGVIEWQQVELTSNRTALRATEAATTELGLQFDYSWSEGGAFVNDIGEKNPQWPDYWHLLVWSNSAKDWFSSSVGSSSLELKDGDVIGWFLARDDPNWDFISPWPGPKPSASPSARFPASAFRYDLYNSGSSGSEGPSTSHLLWKFNTSSFEISATPAVAGDRIFVATWTGMVALNASTGEILWRNPGIKGMSSPAIYNGSIFIGGSDGRLHYLRGQDGQEMWNITLQPNPIFTGISSSPKVSKGRVIIGTFNESGGKGAVYSIYINNGSTAWRYETSSVHLSSAAVYRGNVYIGLAGYFNSSSFSYEPPFGLLSLSEEDGSLQWLFETGGSVVSSPAIYRDRIYFTSKDGNLYALDLSGNKIWDMTIGTSTSSVAIGDGRIFAASGTFGPNGRVYSFDVDGNKIWEFTPNGGAQGSLTYAQGKLYFATNTENGTVYCLEASNGNLVWSFTPEPLEYILATPVVANGKLFIASDNGFVYAIADEAPPSGLNILNAVLASTAVLAVVAFTVLFFIARRK